jgi:hypothetical protein
MKTLCIGIVLSVLCLPWTSYGQGPTTTTTPTPSTTSTPAADLGPQPTITLMTVKATAAGLNVELQAAHLGEMGIQVDKQNKVTGTWVPYVETIYMPIPADIKDTSEPVGGSLVVPLLMPGAEVFYRVLVVGKSKPTDPRDWTNSNLTTCYGFDIAQKPIANSIELQFSEDTLTISTKTDDKVVLKASWQVGSGGTPYGLQATANMQNPAVSLNYGALPKDTSGGFPVMDIGLFDENGTRLQEAKIAVKVASTKPVANKVDSVKNDPVTSSKSSSTKFSWSELAKTGLGALMKYFTMGI